MDEISKWEQVTTDLIGRAGLLRPETVAVAPEEAVLEIARRQHGVVSRAQLEHLDFSSWMIDLWARDQRLIPVHSGVYAVGHDVLVPRGRWLAAVLTARGRATLSHWSAGGLWGPFDPGRRPIEITRVSGPGKQWPGLNKDGRAGDRSLVVHRTRMIDTADFTVKDGIPVTSLARTYLDVAATATEQQLESGIAEGERMGIIDLHALTDVLSRANGRKGAARLRRVLEKWHPEFAETNLGLEELCFNLCRRHHLPDPSCNVIVEGLEVDFLWSAQRLVVELDSLRHHGNRPALTRDYSRDMKLRAAGYEVHRYTHEMVTRHEHEVAESIRSALLARTPRVVPNTQEGSG